MFSYQKEWDFQNNHENIIIGLFDKSIKLEGKLQLLDEQFEGELTSLVKDGDISAKKKAITVIHTFGKIGAKRIIFVGLGKEKELTFDELKAIFGATFKRITSEKWVETAIYLDSFVSEENDAQDVAHASSEAFGLATYEFSGYKQKSNEPEKRLQKLLFIVM